jgi:hypothetical protein
MSWKKDFRPVHVKVQYMQLKLSVSVSGQFLASVVHDQKIACFFPAPALQKYIRIMPVLRFYIWMVASARCAV